MTSSRKCHKATNKTQQQASMATIQIRITQVVNHEEEKRNSIVKEKL